MTKTKGVFNESDWVSAIITTRAFCRDEYAIMLTMTGKEKRLVIHINENLINRMKWRRGDRLNVLVSKNDNCVALKRSVGDEPGMVLSGKDGDKLRVQFHCRTREIVGITDRVIVKFEDLVYDRDTVIFSKTWE
jgi:hypothetical protein